MRAHHDQRIRQLLAVALLLLGFVGCSATSDFMTAVRSPQPLGAAPEDAAQVVFIRPSGFAPRLKATILDGTGKFLGDSLPESYFVRTMPPGKHVFIGWAENTAALPAELAAGRTYHVEVAPQMGAFSARVQLLALTERHEKWAELGAWISRVPRFDVDDVGGNAYLTSRAEDVQERIKRANELLAEYDAEQLAARTLRPEDGR